MKLKIYNIIILIIAFVMTVIETILFVNNYSINSLLFYVVGLLFLFFSFIGLIAPKCTFKMCWKIFGEKSDYDYEYGLRNLPKVIMGITISSICFQTIALLITVL